MNNAAPSIDQLKELALPDPVSYMPQTWGWAALLLVILLGLSLWAVYRNQKWRRNAYRRDALARLAQLQRALTSDSGQLAALRELPELLKRVALSMPGQPQVGTLSGDAWQTFLVRHSPERLPPDFDQQLARLAYAPDAHLQRLDSAQRLHLLSLCKVWVEHHHVAA